ncbi:MAG: FAD-dependent oxidoreductase [Actinobacteria bacterium]|nr:FAD-dependent oxidoreductase [Actinomycetota bacterium]
MVNEKFDVVIVGAGPAGISAAIPLAKAGLKVIVLERGEYPGSKNVMGGILYRHAVDEVIPGFYKEAPLERHITRQSAWMMTKDSAFQVGYQDLALDREPYNSFSVFRANFDSWYAGKAREADVLIVNETVVEGLIIENGRIVGVKTGRPDGDIRCDVVVIADGVNSLLARDLGLRGELTPDSVTLAVKEIISLDEAVINQRFSLTGLQGATIELVGEITQGMVGIGFIYTNRKSISVGIGALISEFKKTLIRPYELLDSFKSHPFISPLIEGGESREYLAHMIPEIEFNKLPKPYGNGFLLAGDAAGFGNVVHREGSNLAMTSGYLAAQTILKAKERDDYSENSLSYYKQLLERSYIIKDMKKYRNFKKYLETHKEIFTIYPSMLSDAVRELFIVDNVSKKEKQKKILKSIRGKRSLYKIVKDIYSGFRAFW